MDALSIVVMNWRDRRNPAAGGAELYIHEIAKRWAQKGHRVTLLTSRFEGAPAEETIDGVVVMRRGSRYSVYRAAKRAYLDSFRSRCDAVIDAVNTIPFFTPKYVDADTRLFVLVFQLAREGWFYETPWPVAIVGRYLLEDHWLKRYSSVPAFAISESTRQDLLRLGYRDVSLIRPGVSPPPEGITEKKETTPTLLFVGRLKKYKLPHHAIEAFKRVREKVPTAQLWVIGDGYMRKPLERLAPAGVTLFGHVSESEKSKLMQRAHVLLCPSVREGWGLVVTEANSLGTPAIGYDVPGLRDSIQDGTTGVLVPPNDTVSMADAAIGLLQDKTRLMLMSAKARAWTRQLDWDLSASAMLERITTSMEAPAEPGPN